MRGFLAVWGMAFLATACMKPIIRQDPQLAGVRPGKKSDAAPKRVVMTPDLNKKLWILPFTKSYAPTPELERYSIPEIFQVEAFGETAKENNPFILPTSDLRTLKSIGIDSDTEEEELIKIARGASIDGFITGSIVDVSIKEEEEAEGVLRTRRVSLTLVANYSLYDAISGRKIHSGTASGTFSETRSDVLRMTDRISQPQKKLARVSRQAAEKLLYDLSAFAGKMGWSGKILKIESNRIFINSGRKTGIRLGDVLKVLERSRGIYDPDSGEAMGTAPGRLKGTVKVVQYFGLDGSIAILQSGGGIFPGDRIELY